MLKRGIFMAKKWKFALLTLFFVFLLTGCVDVDLHLTINPDGTGTFKVKMVGNDMAGNMLMESYDQEKASLEQEGYKVKKIVENGKQGYEAVKPINIKDLQTKMGNVSKSDPLSSFDSKNFKYDYQEGLFFHTHKVEGNIDLRDLAATDGMDQAILDQMNLRLLVTLPTSTDKHNATSVEGNTLIWKLKPGENNHFYFEANQPNWTTWGIVIALALVVIAIIIWYVMKKKANTPPMQAAGAGGTSGPAPTLPPVQSNPSETQENFNWDDE
jgi:hypothetical protein